MTKALVTSLTIMLIGVLAACNIQPPEDTGGAGHEFQPGDAEQHKPGVTGEVNTVTLPDSDGNPVTFSYEVIDGLAIFEGDMILGTAEELAELADADELVLKPQSSLLHDEVCWRFIFNLKCKEYRWPGGIVPYNFQHDWGDESTNAMMRQRIWEAMDEVMAVTAVRFVPRRAGHEDYVTFQSSTGCSAHVGRQGGQQSVFLSTSCGKWTVVHELLHALGVMHEHTRDDRDDFVQVNFDNIRSDKEHNFETSKFAFDSGRYDYESIMHYPSWAFCERDQHGSCVGATIETKPPGTSIGQRSFLSDGDIAGINAMYRGPDPELTLRSPTDGAERQLNRPISFTVAAHAPDFVPECCFFSWDIGGEKIRNHRVNPSSHQAFSYTFTTEGSHEVTVRAHTSTGAGTSKTITVDIVNTPPRVSIIRPIAGEELLRDQPFLLRGSSRDPNEPGGRLDCSQLTWESNVAEDGFRAAGCEVEVSFRTSGARTLTLTGIDSQGATGTASVDIEVVDPPAIVPPAVRIREPEPGFFIRTHETADFVGSASEPGGPRSLEFEWYVTYDLGQGPVTELIGTEPTLSWTPSDTLPLEPCHSTGLEVELQVTNPEGATGSDFVEGGAGEICLD